MRTIDEHVDELVAHLRFPAEHRKRTRNTNLLERTFVEVRRRTKVIGRFPGETSALSLIWAVLELASRGWRGITMTPRAVAQIERLRRGQSPLPTAVTTTSTEKVVAASSKIHTRVWDERSPQRRARCSSCLEAGAAPPRLLPVVRPVPVGAIVTARRPRRSTGSGCGVVERQGRAVCSRRIDDPGRGASVRPSPPVQAKRGDAGRVGVPVDGGTGRASQAALSATTLAAVEVRSEIG